MRQEAPYPIADICPEQIRHLNQKQLARRWGVSTRCLERWRARGGGPAFMLLGRRVIYRLSDVEAFELIKLRIRNDPRPSDPVRANQPPSACR